ncbi:hypothetical protein AEA09_10585 [Lysinibacillus contaminans]|uniref:NADH dehydrogenase n=1 Tax=Lysinibacillus contaminans TaxID=1293441 RepID=A0ABR5K2F4_9BACI|nr:hypothetical protein [Lysinibacillus contaminans]KOS68948.1 hypothetical protein AEA09_10585 [Lysinibacillus contaminans]
MYDKVVKGCSIFIFIVTITVLALIIAIPILFSAFNADFRGDLTKSEKKKIISQTEQYLYETYPTMKYEIFDFINDNDEFYDNFEYAAMVRNTETKETFVVYENMDKKQIEDTQEEEKFINEQVKPKVISYVNKTFGEPQSIIVRPPYEVDGQSTIFFHLNNKKEDINEEMLQSFIDYLQDELRVKHANVSILYDNEKWKREF